MMNLQWLATARSWDYPFKGDDHEQLWTHMSHYWNSKTLQLYQHMCSVVQSSGMGKSRTVDELGKYHFVIPMSLNKSKSGYPPPDGQVSGFLTEDMKSASHALQRCIVFLNALFKHTAEVLRGNAAKDSKEGGVKDKMAMVAWFHDKMSASNQQSEFRKEFYARVLKIAQEKTPVDVADVKSSADNLVKTLRELSPGVKSNIEIVLAFDEAHVLCEQVNVDSRYKQQPWSMYTMLQTALNNLHFDPIWSLFISTSPKLTRFNPDNDAPPRKINPSDSMFKRYYATVPPFTALTYDLFAPIVYYMRNDGSIRTKDQPEENSWDEDEGGPAMKRPRDDELTEYRNLTLERATETKFIVGFGRPLFILRYEEGSYPVRDNIGNFAAMKLICDEPFPYDTDSSHWARKNVNAMFACLSQRLFLEFRGGYNSAEETQIRAHMRLCLKIEPDEDFFASRTPSEPLLAEAASILMLTEKFKPAESLKRVISKFPIDTGERGELVAALAVTVARDLAVKTRLEAIDYQSAFRGYVHAWRDKPEPFFRAVTVLSFLEHLLALDSAIGEEEKQQLVKDFEDAYIYFSHYSKPFDPLACTLESLLMCMTRGIAIRCGHIMPGVDAVHGILFKSPDSEGIVYRLNQLSTFLYLTNSDPSTTRTRWDGLLMPMDAFLADTFRGASVENPLPVVRIVFALAAKDEGLHHRRSVLDLGNGLSVICHDFWCSGMSNNVFLPNKIEEVETWQELLKATMKINQIFDEPKDPMLAPAFENRKRMASGASSTREFWAWVDDDDSNADADADGHAKEEAVGAGDSSTA